MKRAAEERPPYALDAPSRRAGEAVVTVAGPEGVAPPLLLVHSVNATASAHEVRPLFEALRATRRVIAIDLPGFGLAPRAPGPYTPRRMTDALFAALEEAGGGGPVDALAVSLSCEFLARAAVERPRAFRRLALVSPTAMDGTRLREGQPGEVRGSPRVARALEAGPWGRAMFGLLVKPGSVRFFLRKTFGSERIDERLWADAVAAAGEPGAHHAPLWFVAGALFAADAGALYAALPHPVWASHGTRGDFTDYRAKAVLASRPNWRFTVYEGCGALPYFERPEAFARDLGGFLAAT
jgi:pimeloyl-ACP methyl ester carboxylesterase